MEGNYLSLNQVNSYKISLNLANYVWNIVLKFNYFEKDTIGKQLARSIDSISANIAEGFGRYNKKDKIKFYRYSFGSMKESQDWIYKCFVRKIINEVDYNYIMEELNKLPKEINSLIYYTNTKLKF
ncbi:MAG: four helix bundle protein [Candidatus Magasanikbacteria bacterium CG_4_10_14_0_2_um_filter_33_14]|uniref:Four helix bundle protein n=1 Tax=Candidatus Magasanikbacteria bacterium CG_4_10_14_0_2_um_filter_33_14 TaxID=1974636 RepID=A0A2M7V932_9BACT|nr:MAG: four helix bundle protein [Candidatus Magasanikbacteria bacterium CG_4_10_14_0_2_um_filter_33_14]